MFLNYLTHSGKLAPLIKLMMIPDAWSKRSKTVPKNHQDLFNFLNSSIEPWDGPQQSVQQMQNGF